MPVHTGPPAWTRLELIWSSTLFRCPIFAWGVHCLDNNSLSLEQEMTRQTKFKPGQSGNPKTMFKPGNRDRWVPGVSGNPTGKSRHRACFEEAFNEALITR